MRPLLVLTILLLGLNITAPQRKDSWLIGDYFHPVRSDGVPLLLEIESSVGRGDRLVSTVQSNTAPNQMSQQTAGAPEPTADATPSPSSSADAEREGAPEVSMDDLCTALMTSAQQNALPVPFFANLIWQESRLRDDAVSPVGALGIAQFMPQVATASGLDNPFDPLQAIAASARLLGELRNEFGNLGYVAAAYNAGARRVIDWLEHRRTLPRETREYVVRVTGRSADDWRKTPPDDAQLTFVRRLPCRALPEYADLEQARMRVAEFEKAEAQPAKMDAAPTRKSRRDSSAAIAERNHVANPVHSRVHDRHGELHVSSSARHHANRMGEVDRVSRVAHIKNMRLHGRRLPDVRVGMGKAIAHRGIRKRV